MTPFQKGEQEEGLAQETFGDMSYLESTICFQILFPSKWYLLTQEARRQRLKSLRF
jgi:hypothetical protein